MKKVRSLYTQRGSRNRKTWACEPAERNRVEEKYDLSASYREPKSARVFLRAAENAAVSRRERQQARQRAMTCVGLTITAVGLLCVSALVPGRTSSSERGHAGAAMTALPAAEVFAEGESGRKDWCYTFLILQRDEEAENLKAATVGMLDRQEKSLSLVSVPRKLLVETGVGIRTLEDVYAESGAYGVKDRVAGLLGYPVDHYVSLSSETAAEIFRLLDDGTVLFPPLGEQSGAWCAVLENALAGGYIRNRDWVISLLTGESTTTLTTENLRWYAGELLKLGGGNVFFYALPTEAVSEGSEEVAVRSEEWLRLLNEALNPEYETITNENIRVTTAE